MCSRFAPYPKLRDRMLCVCVEQSAPPRVVNSLWWSLVLYIHYRARCGYKFIISVWGIVGNLAPPLHVTKFMRVFTVFHLALQQTMPWASWICQTSCICTSTTITQSIIFWAGFFLNLVSGTPPWKSCFQCDCWRPNMWSAIILLKECLDTKYSKLQADHQRKTY